MQWDWAFVWTILPTLGQGVIITIQATILGAVLAMVAGLGLAIARRASSKLISRPAGLFANFVRGTPLLVQLYFLFYILPDIGIVLPPLAAGVIGLGLHYATYTAEVYRTGIDNIPRGQWEAAKAINISQRQTWVQIILPKAI
jgi:polar amino acid transport system permease protein